MDDLVQWLTRVWDEEEALATSGAGDVASAQIDNYGCLTVPKFQVLARIAADRKILELHTRNATVPDASPSSFARGQDDGYRQALDDVIRLLAEPYADRPGYQESWAVQ